MKLIFAILLYFIPFIPWCRKHSEWEGWNGYFGYVCPECARTPEYAAVVENWFQTHP